VPRTVDSPAFSLKQLERRLSRFDVPADAVLHIIDATGEGWALHNRPRTVSPMTLKKNWTKAELLNLYRASTTGQQDGLPLPEKALVLFIAELLRAQPNKPLQPTRAAQPFGKREPPGSGPHG
jgi:hypothetical protein